MHHSDFDPSLARAWTDLVVPSQATVVGQPSEGALHDPTPWQNGKADLSLWFANDIEHKPGRLLRPFHKSTGVCSIRPHRRYPGKAVLQPFEHGLAAITVLDIGAGDRYGKDQTQYIDHRTSWPNGKQGPVRLPSRSGSEPSVTRRILT